MHPALSVIVFTVTSGAGFGMLAVISIEALMGWDRASFDLGMAARWHGLAEIGAALALCGLGLMVSALHLGRPERAWRAFSQWRSSWLSREGIAAMATFVPALGLAFIRADQGLVLDAWRFVPALCAGLAVATLISTGMIYASLRPIPQWRDPTVVPGYLVLAIASGSIATLALRAVFRVPAQDWLAAFAIGALAAGALLKIIYWRRIDHARTGSTTATAIGLPEAASARLLDPPHTSPNYLLREMGFRIARKHAVKLRRAALAFGFAMPVVLVGTALGLEPLPAMIAMALAAISNIAGTLAERWLFFAEATHVVTLYYGPEKA